MWKFPGAPFQVTIFIILLIFTSFSGGDGDTTLMTVTEGESTQFNFSFPCNSARITLQHGYKTPFYDSNNPETMPMSDRQELMIFDESEGQTCSLRLKFKPVFRSDNGAYILISYDGQGNFLEDSIGLRVDYPPGVASCEWLEENLVDDWGTMLCKAPAGSTPGLIACYQNGIRLPPKTAPMEAGNVLQQTLWVRYSQVAFCCASLQEKLIDKCECKDFIWDHSHSGNFTDPCAAPLQNPAPPNRPEVNNLANYSVTSESTTTPQTITKRQAKKRVLISLYWGLLVVISTLIFIIIILCVVLTAAFQKIRQIMERREITMINDKQYVSVPTVEA